MKLLIFFPPGRATGRRSSFRFVATGSRLLMGGRATGAAGPTTPKFDRASAFE